MRGRLRLSKSALRKEAKHAKFINFVIFTCSNTLRIKVSYLKKILVREHLWLKGVLKKSMCNFETFVENKRST